jgi:hypothetical protein
VSPEALAKLKGLVVEKKASIVARANIPDDNMSQIAEYLDQLEPGARKQIEARINALEQRKSARGRLSSAVEITADLGE